jgi:transposase, IS30 family
VPAPRLPLEKRIRARVLVAEGWTQEDAAAEAGISIRSMIRLVAESGGMAPRRGVCRRSDQLSAGDREQIAVALHANTSFRMIARQVGKAPSTISREVARNGGRDRYEGWKAHDRALEQMSRPQQRWFERCPEAWTFVVAQLRTKKWSPEQIAGRLRTEFPDQPEMWVSHETIYQSIYVQAKGTLKAELAECLRSNRTRRQPQRRAAKAVQGAKIANMVNISERPAEAADRAVPGHWEGDLIIGRYSRSAVATLVERSTRFGMLIKLDDQTANHVADRISERVVTLPDQFRRSLTWDQGSEMAAHQRFKVATGVPVYFCDPRSPWQRGTNENWNGLVRQFLPKGTDLSVHSQADLDNIAELLNERPRKTLDFMTPSERFNELLLR